MLKFLNWQSGTARIAAEVVDARWCRLPVRYPEHLALKSELHVIFTLTLRPDDEYGQCPALALARA